MMMTLRLFLISSAAVSAAALLSACQQPTDEPAASNGMTANEAAGADNEAAATPTAQLIDASGQTIGQVLMSEGTGGVTLNLTATGLPAGTHGVHLHEKGICDQPFESAGAHWNPASKQHGRDNPMGAHLGDLDNIDAAAGAPLSKSFTIAGVSISGAGEKLADADGTSLVIHAAADDYRTDPSGNSGARIACAVLTTANWKP
jgi:superoxide dismutase, Cu-Zn family